MPWQTLMGNVEKTKYEIICMVFVKLLVIFFGEDNMCLFFIL